MLFTVMNQNSLVKDDIIYNMLIDLCIDLKSRYAISLIPCISNEKLNFVDENGKTLLHRVCEADDFLVIDELLKVVDLNIINNDHKLLAELFCNCNNLDQLITLIPNMTNHTINYIFLILMASNKDRRNYLGDLLIDAMTEYDINLVDSTTANALDYICIYRITDILNKLMGKFDLNIISNDLYYIELLVHKNLTEQLERIMPMMTTETINYMLMYACQYGNSALALQIINNLNNDIIYESCHLHEFSYSCKNGLFDVIEKFIDIFGLNFINKYNVLVLHILASDLIDLIKRFIPIMTIETKEITLIYACIYKKTELALSLLDELTKISHFDYRFKTALHHACNYKLSELIDKLINISYKEQNNTEIFESILYSMYIPIELRKIFLDYFVDSLTEDNIVHIYNNYSDKYILQYGKIYDWNVSNIDIMNILDKSNQSLLLHIIPKIPESYFSYIDSDGNTLLIKSIQNNHNYLASYLLPKLSLDIINHNNNEDKNAFHYAIEKKMFNIVKKIAPELSDETLSYIEKCPNETQALGLITKNNMTIVLELIHRISIYTINIYHEYYSSPFLMKACLFGTKSLSLELIKILNKMYDTTINYSNHLNNTPLFIACHNNFTELALALIPRVSDETINLISSDNTTILIIACMNGLSQVALELIPRMNNTAIEVVDHDNKRTALHYACNNKMSKVAIALIQRMSENAIELVDNNNNKAVEYICKNKLSEVSFALIDKTMNPDLVL